MVQHTKKLSVLFLFITQVATKVFCFDELYYSTTKLVAWVLKSPACAYFGRSKFGGGGTAEVQKYN